MSGDPFDLSRAQFIARAAAPDVSANVLKLAYVIAFKRMNVESKMAIVSQKTLAADLNMTVRSVQNLLPMLETFGLVVEPAAGPGKPSVYRVKSLASESESPKAASPIGAKRTNGIASFDGETAKPNSLFPELTSPTPVRKRVLTQGFAEFWQAYPRRLAKGNAEKAYRRIVRNREATEAELLAGAMRYAAQRDGEDPQFTKHPATWLNGKCWMDEPPPNGGRPRSYLDSIAAGLALVPNDDAAS
jgi:hypothetical protein